MKAKISDAAIQEYIKWSLEMGITDLCTDTPQNRFQKGFSKIPQPLPSASMPPKEPFLAEAKEPLKPSRSPQPASPPPLSSPSLSSSLVHQTRSCRTLEELRELMESFEECALKKVATNLVFADGTPHASVMIVGEAPGAEEDSQGRPFVGVSGQLLDRMLATVGLSRQQNVYISNVVPWRPPGNRPPTPQEIAQCLPFIKRHIELVKPQILLLLGGVALKALWGTTEGIMKLRGAWRHYQSEDLAAPLPSIATYHPAFLLRSPGQKAQVWRDFLNISNALKKLEPQKAL